MTEAFCSYSINEDPIFDDEGEEVGITEYWLIEKVWVPLEERGQGKARKMMVDAIAEMQKERADLPIHLWCEALDDETDGEKLVGFYESLGFSATGFGSEMEL